MENSQIKWHLDPQYRCLFTKVYGTIDKARALKHMVEARQDPKFENDFSVLSDVTSCSFQMTADDIREVATYMGTKWPTKNALKSGVIVSSALGHGLARIYSAFSDERGSNTMVFRNDEPNLQLKIALHFEFPDSYKFPEFLDFS